MNRLKTHIHRLKVVAYSSPSLKNPEKGFTLVEILIVIAIIAILAILALLLLNPTRLRYKLYDLQRRNDLNYMKGLLDLELSQNGKFPIGSDICYNSVTMDGGVCSCNICGLESATNPFGNILRRQYCDPENPTHTYVYQYECADDPQWYRLYAHLSQVEGSSCSYGVSNKPDSFLEPYPEEACGFAAEGSGGGGSGGGGNPTATPTPTPGSCPADPIPKYCYLGGICNICGNTGIPGAGCNDPAACDQPAVLYSDSSCTNQCS